MLEFTKKLFKKIKWGSSKTLGSKCSQNCVLLVACIGVLENALLWKNKWLSLCFLAFINVILVLCAHLEVNFLAFVFTIFILYFCIEALETWLVYKHRTSFLKQLAARDETRLHSNLTKTKSWLQKQWTNFIYLRETNHTKAFLLANIVLGTTFVIGRCMSGYLLTYLIVMSMFTFVFWVPPIHRLAKKIQQHAESDSELENLIPVVTDKDLKDLSFEPEPENGGEDRQNLDYWKPEDLPISGDISDSSENSNSIVTNMSMEKLQKIERDDDTSDSSDDEYIPLVEKKEQLQSTLEIVDPNGTWSNSAYNALRGLTGVVSNMYSRTTPQETEERKKLLSSADSSDGFEIIDKSDFL